VGRPTGVIAVDALRQRSLRRWARRQFVRACRDARTHADDPAEIEALTRACAHAAALGDAFPITGEARESLRDLTQRHHLDAAEWADAYAGMQRVVTIQLAHRRLAGPALPLHVSLADVRDRRRSRPHGRRT
jgi:hypothetical protein